MKSIVIMIGVAATLAATSCKKHEQANNSASKQSKAKSASHSPQQKPALSPADFSTKAQATGLGKLGQLKKDLKASVQADPQGTLQAIDALSPGSKRSMLLRDLFELYPSDKAHELVSWVDKSPLKEDRELLAWLLKPSQKNLPEDRTLDLISNCQSKEVRDSLVKYFAWTAVDIKNITAVKEKSEQLPEANRQRFLDQYASSVSSKDLERGAELVLNNPRMFGQGLIEEFSLRVGSQDGEKYADKFYSYVQSSNNETALQNYVSAWFGTDSMQASKWVVSLTGHHRDLASAEIVKMLIIKGDAQSARQWREGIQDDVLRKSLIIK